MAIAESKVARTSPTLPPSAMNPSAKVSAPAALWSRALDDDADVVEGRGDRGMRLVHGDANAAHLRGGFQHRLGDGAGGGLDQAIAARAERFRRRLHHLVIGDGVLELVGVRGFGQIDIQYQIELEGLPDLGLVLHHAVIGVQRQPADEDGIAHRARLMAAATASACAVGATSWTRTMAAPFSTARRCAASEPPSRSMGSDGTMESMKRLREAPTRSGRPKPRQASSRAIQIRLCSGVLPKPMPGSSTIRSSAMPARAAMASERSKKAVTSATMSILGSAASRLCMTMTGTSCPATTCAISGSRCSPQTSLTIAAAASRAQAATAAFIVSIETGTPSAATAGRMPARRLRSSSRVTATALP